MLSWGAESSYYIILIMALVRLQLKNKEYDSAARKADNSSCTCPGRSYTNYWCLSCISMGLKPEKAQFALNPQALHKTSEAPDTCRGASHLAAHIQRPRSIERV